MYKFFPAPLIALLVAMGFMSGPDAQQVQRTPAPSPVLSGMVIVDFGPDGSKTLHKRVEIAHRGFTALDALEAAAKVEFTEADGTHPKAIDAIDGVRTDLAKSRFWLLDVNGRHARKMAHAIVVRDGFEVRMTYAVPPVTVSLDFGAEAEAIETQVPFEPGMTALDALLAIADVEFTQADPTHAKAIDAVNGVRTDLAASRFWMLEVNGQHAMDMPQNIELGAGWEVNFDYMVPPVTVRIDFGPLERAPSEVQVAFRPGMTALDALLEAAEVELTDADAKHPMAIDAVNGVRTDLEQGWFWLYDVNGAHPTVMADAYELKAGFEVDWSFSTPADRPADEASHPVEQAEAVQQRVAKTQGIAGRLGE